jgi:protein TonB
VTDIGDGHAASRGAESRRLWLLIAALVVITAAAGGWYLFGRGGSASEPPEREALTAPVATETPGAESGAALLTEEELIEQAREVAAAEIEKQEEALRQRLEEEFPTPTPFPPTPTPTVTATAAPTVTSTATRVPPTATRVPPTATPVRATPTPAVREGDIVSIGPGVTPPVPIQQATPEYPRMALRLRQAGIVEAEALVGIDGSIEEFRLITVDRPGIGFEAATEAAVRTWRYKPATKFGVKVRMWVTVRVPFKAE